MAAQWYLHIQGDVYGPYNTADVEGYLAEGRIYSTTLATHELGAQFCPLSDYKAFFPPENSAPSYSIPPATEIVSITDGPPPHLPRLPESLILLVVAELQSGKTLAFLQTLQTLGAAERLGEALWFLKTETEMADVHAALAQSLTHDDRLLILSPHTQDITGSNISENLISRVKTLWRKL